MKPYYGEKGQKSDRQPHPPHSSHSGPYERDEEEDETGLAVRGGGRGAAITSSDSRFKYPAPAVPVDYSSEFYHNFTRDPIDWSALLLNYSKSNENFSTASPPDTTQDPYYTSPSIPASTPLAKVMSRPQKRRRIRPDASINPATSSATGTSSTTTTTTTTTSTTRPPKIYLQPTIEIDEEDEDPPRNSLETDSDADVETSESSNGSAGDEDEGKEGDVRENRYQILSSTKSRTKGNYVRRPYNYYDHIASSSRPYYSRNDNHQVNNQHFHRHPLPSSSDEVDEDSSPKYTMIRQYDPHRFATSSHPSLYPGYFHHPSPASIVSEGIGGEEGTQQQFHGKGYDADDGR